MNGDARRRAVVASKEKRAEISFKKACPYCGHVSRNIREAGNHIRGGEPSHRCAGELAQKEQA